MRGLANTDTSTISNWTKAYKLFFLVKTVSSYTINVLWKQAC